MKILVCMVTHNRCAYTRKALVSLLATIKARDRYVIVDNASTDDTHDYLGFLQADSVVLNRRNLFPGAATNIGWNHGMRHYQPDLLMRLDNDIELLPGWRDEVDAAFEAIPKLGMLGILNLHEDFDGEQPVDPYTENGHTINVRCPRGVGGNAVIRRELWDQGLRWSPGAWAPGGNDEDSRFAAAVEEAGYGVARVIPTIANNMSFHRYHDFPEYYNKTAELRGLVAEMSV